MNMASYAAASLSLAEAKARFQALDNMDVWDMDGPTYQAWVADFNQAWDDILNLNEILRNNA